MAQVKEKTETVSNRKSVEAALKELKTIYITGFPHLSSLTYFLVHHAPLKERAVFWFCRGEEESRIERFIRYWNPEARVELLDAMTPAVLVDCLAGRPMVIIVSIDKLQTTRIPDPEHFESSFFTLTEGMREAPATISQKLIELGYEFGKQADMAGMFARRGGILDVYPPNGSAPIRIECADHQIATIHRVDAKTKKITGNMKRMDIMPMRFLTHESTLLDHLPNIPRPLIFYSDPDELTIQYSEWRDIEKKFAPMQRIIYETFAKRAISFDFESAPMYHKNFRELANDLKRYRDMKWQITIATKRDEAITRVLQEFAIGKKGVRVVPSVPELEGWRSARERLLILTDKEVFGRERESAPAPLKNGERKKSLLDALIMELNPGDFVVHADHGIGKFVGMEKNKVDEIIREYFVLEYADGDKLSVPIENADKLSKYIGVIHPKLHRLSGGGWQLVTKKVLEETKNIAKELLELYARRQTVKTEPFRNDAQEEEELAKSFPYDETPDQLQALAEVTQDLMNDTPTDRLICGDVGFGKTEIAIRAAMKAVMNNAQVALLAPTTILTQQHYDTIRERLKQFPINVTVLSRFQSTSEQKKTVSELANGTADIVIGTHRLLSPDIHFKHLGLIIIDEEQRFGVRAKEKLKALRTQAHVLTLTATPIPRTLNLGLSGIRDMSIIQTPPEGRLPIVSIIEPHSPKTVKDAISQELKRNGQVYYLYNKVETIGIKAKEISRLFPNIKVGIVHGRLPERELAHTMQAFDTGKINVLACSTIIENGLDLPNVNTLIVDNATQFGLAQLYQLRGRIGRGTRQAYAYFLYHSRKLKGNAKKRLQALLEARRLGTGFQLALRDLEIRGAGDILGKKQHGHIIAIGYNLYTRLLAQAIEELRTGIPQGPFRDIAIDLPLEAYIPKTLIPEQEQRIILYQKLASVPSVEALRTLKKTMEKNKKLPRELDNLFHLLEIRVLAQKTDIATIDTVHLATASYEKQKRLFIKFIGQIHPEQIARLLQQDERWQFTQDSIKIDFPSLGDQWLEKLKKVIRIFQRQ